MTAATTSPFLAVTPISETVTLVELTRPENNFINPELVRDLADILYGLAEGATRAVVLTGRGKHFCAGADLVGGWRPDEVGADEPHIYDEAVRLFEQPLPVVAAVNGAAIGAGVGLALTADFRVAAPESRFSVNFARIGFHPGFGITASLPRVVGSQAAADLIFTGRRFDGTEAFRIGLCDRLVPAERVRDEAIAWAHEIAESAPVAVRSVRQTLRGDLAERVRAAVVREKAEQDQHMAMADFAEGVLASGERRLPVFVGR